MPVRTDEPVLRFVIVGDATIVDAVYTFVKFFE
jgi:hypothetical protein